MFRFHKTKDIITLFHKASSPASIRVAALLKQASAEATAHATEDQASDHSAQTQPRRAEFDLNITEDAPTTDQLRTILEYVGKPNFSAVVNGARTEDEAIKKFSQSVDNFQHPVTVDWNNGKAVAGANESEILKMINSLPKEQ